MTPQEHATAAQQQLDAEAALTTPAWSDHELVLARARVHATLAAVLMPGTHYAAAEEALERSQLPNAGPWTERRRLVSLAEAHAALAQTEG